MSAAAALEYNTALWINTSHTMSTTFEAGTAVGFNGDGSVYGGTLEYNTALWINTAHTMSTTFEAGEPVAFRADGSVSHS